MLEKILNEYKSFLPCDWSVSSDQLTILKQLIDFAETHGYRISEKYLQAFIEAVNQKLALNTENYQKVLDAAFSEGVKLNYLLKTKIRAYLDAADHDAYERLLRENAIDSDFMISSFTPVSNEITHNALRAVANEDLQAHDIFAAVFSRYCFNLFPATCTSHFFSGKTHQEEEFFEFIREEYPDMCKRDCALSIVDVAALMFKDGYENGCNLVLNAIRDSYRNLANHCMMAVMIPEIVIGEKSYQWKLFSDVSLFAEKFLEEKIDRTYFRWKKIKEQTVAYIDAIDVDKCKFEYGNGGFVFKDCFVVQSDENVPYSLLLIFEKNERDERPVHCPACRSLNIQGNSYPILNVRSWECLNPLCPDRSKYNRGKRYAFMSLLRQRKMEDEENRIPQASITKWRLDCVTDATKKDSLEMIIRHYSCVNDGVVIYTQNEPECLELGRKIICRVFEENPSDCLAQFKRMAYFDRYLIENHRAVKDCNRWTIGRATVINGDSFDALRKMESESIDGAVTSPPYYNAKEYAQWDNIYCYLYDMYNIAKEVYRVLKQGSVYLFNIFDYFDNEKNIVFSAMGNKRMILGAYMLDMFERIGFSVRGNIIWYKGEIQGNRGFNQGNMTPYYQAPLNCWEHIFILSKGEPEEKYRPLVSSIAAIKPVVKMVRGKNVLGHSAPYPMEIPELLIKCMRSTDTILDPFLGSGTTSIVANKYGVNSIGIERKVEYCDLCRTRIASGENQQISFY